MWGGLLWGGPTDLQTAPAFTQVPKTNCLQGGSHSDSSGPRTQTQIQGRKRFLGCLQVVFLEYSVGQGEDLACCMGSTLCHWAPRGVTRVSVCVFVKE